jgi:hypothetical protein
MAIGRQQPHDLDGLVGRDAAGYSEEDPSHRLKS